MLVVRKILVAQTKREVHCLEVPRRQVEHC
jgi:hypothetical protein